MKYEDAIDVLKRGGSIQRSAKTFKLWRGVLNVTDPENPVRYYFTDEDRAADDWVAAEPSEIVAPEVVDEVLHETVPETTLGSLDTEPPQ